MAKKVCAHPGCSSFSHAKGLCSKHYMQLPETKERVKNWIKNNADRYAAIRKESYARNKHKDKDRRAKFKLKNPGKMREYRDKWNALNPEKNRQSKRAWEQRNKDKILLKRSKRYKEQPLYALKIRIRARLGLYFRLNGKTKLKSTQEMIGCSWEELKCHIESKFKPGMNWDNRSEWHVDHIVPLAVAKTEQDLVRLCHYTNLQPLWASENLSKGSKVGISLSNSSGPS